MYSPGLKSVTAKPPSLPVVASRIMPVAVLVITTVAPATTAPCGSVTVPFNVEVGSWAVAAMERAKQARQEISKRYIVPPAVEDAACR